MMRKYLFREIITKKSKRLFYIRFLTQLSALLSTGMNLKNSLDILRQQYKGRFQSEISALLEQISQGHLLSDAMKVQKFYPKMLEDVVEAGENTGQLVTVLERISIFYKKEFEKNEKIKNAMIYPVVLICIIPIVVAFLLTFVLPTFMQLFAQAEELLPLPTLFLINFATWIENQGKYVFIIFIVIYIIYRILTWRGKGKYFRDFIKLQSLFGKIRRENFLIQFSSGLALLLEYGVPILNAMDILERGIENLYLRKKIGAIKRKLEKGSELWKATENENIFPLTFVSMLRVGEESGKIPRLLKGIFFYYEGEVERKVNQIIKLIEPAMILLLAIVVGFVVLAVAIPMFDLVNIISY